ncbi:hypothetical protein [Mammaliicoccus lentus]|uniref:hypothetical protein n=1 Tax=Mammaliicoccus lentus TaxID=42858 RepID=UPI002DBA2B34|nr:hypothetical protein [Mammaliicoccus lentus]MEB8091822.1 hypothetical protein [Mammaliicoccus lentus]
MVRKTKKTYDYFRLYFENNDWEENDYTHINEYFENTLKEISNDVDFTKITEEVHIGINRLEKFAHEQTEVWVFCLSKVNTTKLAVVSKIDVKVKEGREEYGEDPNEGLTTDTVILLCPSTGLVIIPRNKGGITPKDLTLFINKELATTGSTLSVIINGTKVENLSHIDSIKEVQINVTRSVNPNRLKNPRRSRKQDNDIMSFLGGKTMNLVMKSDGLRKQKIIKYFNDLKKSRKKEAKKFVVIGENDGQEQIIDLITNRMIYYDKDVELNENNKLTIDSMFNSIKKAYCDNKSVIYLDIFKE